MKSKGIEKNSRGEGKDFPIPFWRKELAGLPPFCQDDLREIQKGT